LEIRAVYSLYDSCLNVVSVSRSDVMCGGIAECDNITVQLYIVVFLTDTLCILVYLRWKRVLVMKLV
jgi:hypothetical protein